MATLPGPSPTHLCVVASRPRTSSPIPAAPCASGCGHQSHPAVVGAPWSGPTEGRLGGGDTGHSEPKLEDRLARPHSLPALCQDKTPQGLSTAFQLSQPPVFLTTTEVLTTSLPTCSCPVTSYLDRAAASSRVRLPLPPQSVPHMQPDGACTQPEGQSSSVASSHSG